MNRRLRRLATSAALLVAVGLTSLYLTLTSRGFERRFRDALVSSLEARLGAPLRAARLDVEPLRLRVRFTDIAWRDPGGGLEVAARRVLVSPDPWTLLVGRPGVVVELDGGHAGIDLTRGLPRLGLAPGASGRRGPYWQLRLSDTRLSLRHSALELELSGLRGEVGSTRLGEGTAGGLRFELQRLALAGRELGPGRGRGEVRFVPGSPALLRDLRLEMVPGRVQLAGTIDPAGGALDLQARASLDATRLSAFLGRPGAARGTLQVRGQLAGSLGRPRLRADLHAPRLTLAGTLPLEAVSGTLLLGREELRVTQGAGRLWDGSLKFHGSLPLKAAPRASARFDVTGLDVAHLHRDVARLPLVAGSLSAQGSIAWSGTEGPLLEATSDFRALVTSLAEGARATRWEPVFAPLDGSARLRYGERRLDILDVRVANAWGAASGAVSLGPDRSLGGSFRFHSTQLRAISGLQGPELPWLTRPGEIRLDGPLAGEGRLGGTVGDLELRLAGSADRIRLLGLGAEPRASRVDLEDTAWSASLQERRWSWSARASRPAPLVASGQVLPQPAGDHLQTVTLRASELDASVLAGLVASPLAATGTTSLELDLTSREGRTSGELALTGSGSLAGRALDHASLRLGFGPDELRLHGLRLASGAASLDLAGSLGRADRRLELTVAVRELPLASLAHPAAGRLEGQLDAGGSIGGTPGSPRGALRLAVRGLVVAGIPLGDLEGTLELRGLREAPLAIRLARREELRLELSVDTASPYDFESRLRFASLAVPAAYLPERLGLGGTLGGTLRARGQLAGASPLTSLELEAAETRLTMAGIPLRASRPWRARLVPGPMIEIQDLALTGELSQLAISGVVGAGDVPSDLRIRGEMDIRLLGELLPGASIAGPVRLDVRVQGSAAAPGVAGSAELLDGYFRSPALPYPLREATARASLEGRTVRLEGLRARFGGGRLEADGEVDLEDLGEPRARIHARGEDVRFTLFRSLELRADPDLTWELDSGTRSLSGRLEVTRAIYRAAGGFAPRASGLGGGESEALGGFPRTELAIQVVADGNVWFVSDDARIEGNCRLQIGGTTADPVVLGSLNYLRAPRLRLQGRRYRIARGSLVFDNPALLDPRLEVEAQTNFRGYDVILEVRGSLASPRVFARSDPPLPQSEVFALLVGGSAPDESGLARSETNQEVLRSLFLPLALGRLRVPGGHLSVDPSALGGKADPTEVLPLSIQAADQLSVTVGVPIRDTRPSLVIFNWTPLESLTVSAIHDVDSAYGADLLFRRRFGAEEPEAGPAPRVASLRFEGLEAGEPPSGVRGSFASRPGRPFREEALRADVERLAAWLAAGGRPLARIQADSKPGPGNTRDIELRVDPGPEVTLELSDPTASKDTRTRLLETLQSFGIQQETLVEMEKSLRRMKEEKGYARSLVSCDSDSTDPGGRVTIRCDMEPGPRYRLGAVRLVGDPKLSAGELKAVLGSREGFLRPSRLRSAQVGEDVSALRELYRSEGYLDATVRAEIREAPSSGVLDLLFHLDAGPRFRIGVVDVAGAEAVPAAELRRSLGLRRDAPLLAGELEQARSAVFRRYDTLGYMSVRVQIEPRRRPPEPVVDLTVNIQEGRPVRVREIRIEGARATAEAVIRRELRFQPGGLLSYRRIGDSQNRIYDLTLFRSVEILPLEVPGSPGERDVVVRVTEAPPYRLDLGAGYESRERLRGLVGLAASNLGGRGRYAALNLRGSATAGRFQLLYREPRPFDLRLPTLLSSFWEQSEEVSFDLTRLLFRLESSLPLDRKGKNRALFRYSLSDTRLSRLAVSPLEAGAETVRLSSLGAAAIYDRRDDILEPRSGQLASADLEWASARLGSQADFLKLTLRGFHYQPLSRRTTWVSGLQLGFGWPRGGADSLPLAERYFAGGASTLRGFGYNEAGPRDPGTGRPTGGSAYLVLNQELRLDVLRRLVVTAFVDAGNVYRRTRDLALDDLRLDVGAGLRYRYGIVAGFDYARLLDRREGEPRERLHFSLGFAF